MDTFAKRLDKFIKKADCSAALLSKEAGISPSGLSRYRNGDRTPDRDIIDALSDVLSAHNVGTRQEIFEALISLTENKSPEYPQLGHRLSELITRYDISLNSLARHIGFDPSFISRIKAGRRYPSNPDSFIESVAEYILQSPAFDYSMTKSEITSYLRTASSPTDDLLSGFIHRIKTPAKENLTPNVPAKIPQLKGFRSYTEPNSLESAISDITALIYQARTKNDIYILSDAASDMKQLVKAAVSKGVRIHLYFGTGINLSKTISDLSEYIPFFQTGLVTPYYLPKNGTGIFSHVLISTGVYSLFGEFVTESPDKCRYTVSGQKDDVLQTRRYTKYIFNKALPIMNISDPSNIEIYHPGILSLLKPYLSDKEAK